MLESSLFGGGVMPGGGSEIWKPYPAMHCVSRALSARWIATVSGYVSM